MATSPPGDWQSLGECYERARDMPDAQRSQWLADMAVERPELATAVRELLEQHNRPGYAEFLETPLVHGNARSVEASLIGRMVGPYVIEKELGRGGMGSVWLGRRVDGRFDAIVAIKFLHMSWMGDEGQRRFRTEGHLLGRLNHPNIARLIDAGVLEGLHPYLVIEYIEGDALDEYCERLELGLEARLALFLEVLSAVSHAHGYLVVHRDIKPRNVLVTASGSVKLLDFGVAKLLDSAAGIADAPSVVTALTPQFAAPEQFLGQVVTTATDVYSLGLTLYVLLTGVHPLEMHSHPSRFPKPSAAAESIARASSLCRIPTIPSRSLEGDLDNILAKATNRSPDDRYASAEAFADDLHRYLNHEPVRARADTTAYRLSKFVRRHRGSIASGLLTAFALCLITLIALLQKVDATRQRDVAEFEARRAESANEFLDMLLLSDGSGRAESTAAQRIERGARMLELEYRDDPRFAGRMLVQLSTQYRGQTATQKAVELDQRAYDLGHRVGDAELMALAQCAAAYAEASAGLAANAAPRMIDAKGLLGRVRQLSISSRIDCARAEAMLDMQTNRFAEADRILAGSRQLLEQSGQTYSAAYTSVLNDLGGVYLATGRPSDALAMARLIGATHERYGRGGTTARVIAMQNEATVLSDMGEIREAVRMNAEARRRRLAIQGDSSEPLSMSVNDAEALVRLGMTSDGLEMARAAVDRATAVGNSLWRVYALRTECAAYINVRDFPSAESVLGGLSSAISHGSVTDRHVLMMPTRLRALLDLRRGDAVDALQEAQGALALSPDQDKAAEMRIVLSIAAQAALALGKPSEAQGYARRALAIAEATARGPDTSADVGEMLLLLAKAAVAQEQRLEASGLLQRAVVCLTNGLGASHPLTQEATELMSRIRS